MDDLGGLDSITDVTEQGFLSRLGKSLGATVFGLAMIAGAIVLLSWNEGRAVDAATALDAGAHAVVSVAADAVDRANDGRLVHVQGVATGGTIRDPALGLGWANMLRARRTVEMYQWEEKESTRSEKQLGGSERTETTYSYTKVWADHPIDSSHFRLGREHRNPPMPLRTVTVDARDARLGAHPVSPAVLENLNAFRPLSIDGPVKDAAYRPADGGLYRGADPADPRIGDVRVRFDGVEAQPITVIATQTASGLMPHTADNGYTIALIQPGAKPAAAMFNEAKHDEAVFTWIMRGVGYVVMLIGAFLIFSPLIVLVSVLPFLEPLANAGAFIVALGMATPLTLGTIAVAWFAHRPVLSLVLIAAGLLVMVGLPALRRKRAAA